MAFLELYRIFADGYGIELQSFLNDLERKNKEYQ